MSSRIHTLCGRIHLGPVCVNSQLKHPVCMACGEDVTDKDREQVQRTWNIVRSMLDKFQRGDRPTTRGVKR